VGGWFTVPSQLLRLLAQRQDPMRPRMDHDAHERAWSYGTRITLDWSRPLADLVRDYPEAARLACMGTRPEPLGPNNARGRP
jgi:hypothetical protein